jgi:hypothetical protein
VAIREEQYAAEGYDAVSPPAVYAMGQPATCVKATSKHEEKETKVECAIVDGQKSMLATYSGPEAGVLILVPILGSVQESR